MAETRYTRRHLIEAYVSAERWSARPSPEGEMRSRRYLALAEAFGVQLDKAGDGPATPSSYLAAMAKDPKVWLDDRARWTLHGLFRTTVKTVLELESPFILFARDSSRALEPFRKKFGKKIDTNLVKLREEHFALLEELVEAIWGITPDQTVSASQVRAHGFDPARERAAG